MLFCSYLWVTTLSSFFFFFNDTATTEIYTLSLHDALPISRALLGVAGATLAPSTLSLIRNMFLDPQDRKSTRLNSSHGYISYAVFCLKKKKKKKCVLKMKAHCNLHKPSITTLRR